MQRSICISTGNSCPLIQRRTWLLGILFVLSYSIGMSQTPKGLPVRYYDGKDGLSHSMVNEIVQDELGVVWIATEDGLTKWDGYRFTGYWGEVFNSRGLPFPIIRSMCMSRTGDLWLGGQAGLALFNPKTEAFTYYQVPDTFPTKLSEHSILALHEDRQGRLWVGGSKSGLWLIDQANVRWLFFSHDPEDPGSLSHPTVTCLFEDRKGRMWIGTPHGINLFHQGRFNRFLPRADVSLNQADMYITALIQGPGNKIWVGTEGGLALLDPETGQWDRVTTSAEDSDRLRAPITALATDHKQQLWVATKGDRNHLLFSLDPGSGRIEPNETLFPTISSNYELEISCLTRTRDDVLLIGFSAGMGVMPIFEPNGESILLPKPPQFTSNGRNYAFSFAEDTSGALWVSSRSEGIFSIRSSDADNLPMKLRNHQKQLQVSYHGPLGTQESALSSPHIWPVLVDTQNRLWVGTQDQGIDVLEIEGGILRNIRHVPTAARNPNHPIFSLYEAANGYIWVGGKEYLASIDPNTFEVRTYLRDRALGAVITPAGWVGMIREDTIGNIWVSQVAQGAFRLDPVSGKAIRYGHDPDDRTSLSHDGSMSVVVDHQNHLWVSALGLNLFDQANETFTYYGRPHGLADDFIYSAIIDHQHRMWLYTSQGLTVFDPETRRFSNISDPSADFEGCGNCAYVSQAGELIYGEPGMVTVFHPDSFYQNTLPPEVVLTDFRVFNESVPLAVPPDSAPHGLSLPRHISYSDTVLLRHEHNNFSIEFAGISLHNPAHNQFQYRLLPFQENWISTPADLRLASYTNLDPGNYVFEVMAANNDGVWNPEPRRLYLLIAPPWWRTTVAYLMYLLLIAAIAWGAFRTWQGRLRMRQQLEREQFEKAQLAQVDQMKSRFFANISHEFRTPLTLILGPAQQLLDQPERPAEERKLLALIHRNGQRLRDLINQVLDLNQLETQQMVLKPEVGNLVRHLRFLSAAFESLAHQQQLAYRYALPEAEAVFAYDRDKLEKIVNNLLSNAFKFTPADGTVEVTVSEAPQSPQRSQWTIRVADTGPGIAADQLPRIFDRYYQADDSATRRQEGSGIGLALTKELVELMGGTIGVESTPGAGTVFTVSLPLDRAQSEIATAPVVEEPVLTAPVVAAAHEGFASGEDAGKPIVLVVEDNADMQQFIRASLQDTYQIAGAANGREGLALAAETVPDLVISDVMMPEMDGLEFCARLKQQETTSHIPVVMLTARAGVDSKVEGYETGAEVYLTKPFEARELRAVVANLIAQRQKLRAAFGKVTRVEPKKMAITPVDEQFLDRVQQYLEAHYANPALSVELFAENLGMSRMQLHRKLKALLDQSGLELIRSFRLGKAKDLLEQSGLTVAEIAYAVGFEDPAYFGRVFKQQVGETPAAYTEKFRSENESEGPMSA